MSTRKPAHIICRMISQIFIEIVLLSRSAVSDSVLPTDEIRAKDDKSVPSEEIRSSLWLFWLLTGAVFLITEELSKPCCMVFGIVTGILTNVLIAKYTGTKIHSEYCRRLEIFPSANCRTSIMDRMTADSPSSLFILFLLSGVVPILLDLPSRASPSEPWY